MNSSKQILARLISLKTSARLNKSKTDKDESKSETRLITNPDTN